MGLFSPSEPASQFPEALGKRMSTGEEVRFPDDLPADATLLVVSFRDDLDPLSDQWARLGDRLTEAHRGRVVTWELPVVNKKLKVFGKLATVGIRGQVEGDDERDRTVPLYVDTKSFRKALGLKSQSDVYAFLVARDGRIAWRGEGDIDMEEVETLEHAVRSVLGEVDDAAMPDSNESHVEGGSAGGAEAKDASAPPRPPGAGFDAPPPRVGG